MNFKMMLHVKQVHGDLGVLGGERECLRVLFVVCGHGGIRLCGKDYGLGAGTVCFVDSGKEVGVFGKGDSLYVLEFDKLLWAHFLRSYPLARGIGVFSEVVVLDLDVERCKIAEGRVSQLLLEVLAGVSEEHQKLLFGLFMLDVLMEKVGVVEAVDLPKRLLSEFVELLEVNFKKERSTRFYARRLAVSSRRLNGLCRGWFSGRDVFEVLMDRICSEAELMLLGSDVPVKAVAYELGFSSTQHFRMYFKRFRGVTPTELRES